MKVSDLNKDIQNIKNQKPLSNENKDKLRNVLTNVFDVIEKFERNGYFNKNPNNINGFIRTKVLPNNDENSKYFHALKALTKRNPKAITFISDLASTEKGTGKELLNSLPNNNPTVLRAWNKDLVNYYKSHGYTQLIHPGLRGKLNMYKI